MLSSTRDEDVVLVLDAEGEFEVELRVFNGVYWSSESDLVVLRAIP